MREKKHSEILFVPPGGSKIRTFRLRGGLLLFLFLVFLGGFAGYFIPFSSFSSDVVEQNRQKNLESQNKKLLFAIRPMRKLLDNLNEEVLRLDKKRRSIVEKLGMKVSAKQLARQKNKAPRGDFLNRINRQDKFFQGIYTAVSQHAALFDSIPLIKPIADDPMIGARFEQEKDPFTQATKIHFGIDFIAPRGTPVLSSASGVVSKVEESRIWGKRVTITHGFGYSSVYAHLGTVEAFSGKRVKKGDCIGAVGISGMTSGPHVHYEVWYRGVPVDPEELFFPSVDSVINTALR